MGSALRHGLCSTEYLLSNWGIYEWVGERTIEVGNRLSSQANLLAFWRVPYLVRAYPLKS